jgi:hypothetical protein
MILEGSCHCGRVKFSLRSPHPYPFSLCYCSICRKTAGGGGFAINLGGDYKSLKVEGQDNVSIYQALIPDTETGEIKQSTAKRHFCKHCGSALWVWDPDWPDLVHPFASAVDSDLPVPPERTHLMKKFKAPWVKPCTEPRDKVFDYYPDESLADWHQRLGLEE